MENGVARRAEFCVVSVGVEKMEIGFREGFVVDPVNRELPMGEDVIAKVKYAVRIY